MSYVTQHAHEFVCLDIVGWVGEFQPELNSQQSHCPLQLDSTPLPASIVADREDISIVLRLRGYLALFVSAAKLEYEKLS